VVRQVEHIGYGRVRMTDLEPVTTPYDGHPALIAQFLDWLDGGPAPATAIADNIHTSAICFAAAKASRERTVVDVAAMLQAAGVG
jgi:hypothetical protein